MAGNERSVVRYLVQSKDNLDCVLKHLGQVKLIQAPSKSGLITVDKNSIESVVTESSSKKADIYINSYGVSIKQKNASVLYNRIQRKNILDLLNKLQIKNPNQYLNKIDKAVDDFHHGLTKRDRDWDCFFDEDDFKRILEYLMMRGSLNLKDSKDPASYILEAPKILNSFQDIKVYTFNEYFEKCKKQITFGIRRSWIGQGSQSEHKRALSLSKNQKNNVWVYNSISGNPHSGWNTAISPEFRRTVYYISLMKR
jgi:hypothetical protein